MSFTSVDAQHLLTANRTIVCETLRQQKPRIDKIRAMQDIYLSRNAALYSDVQVTCIRQGLTAVHLKNVLAHTHLEELWVLSMECRWNLLDLIQSSVEKQVWTDEERIIGMMHLESFFIQARAFLNTYKYYICLIMNREQPGTMTRDNFKRHMQRVNDPRIKKKADQITRYFDEFVFGDGQWGKLIKDIRDKIVHQGNLRPSADGEEIVIGQLLDWPTIRGMTFDRFAQQFSNGVSEMLRSTTPILFDLEWKAGPYRENLWQE